MCEEREDFFLSKRLTKTRFFKKLEQNSDNHRHYSAFIRSQAYCRTCWSINKIEKIETDENDGDVLFHNAPTSKTSRFQ